jgi:hypothetical protein
MKVWVVLSGYEFDGDTPRAVFTTEEAARRYETEMSEKEKPLPFLTYELELDPKDA